MKERIKSAGFWVSAISAVFLILGAFGVEIGDAAASNIINGVCSVLIMFGIIKPNGGIAFAGDGDEATSDDDDIGGDSADNDT